MSGELYEWTATDPRTGGSRTYQTHGPDVPEAAMLEHLRKHFHGLRITGIRRVGVKDYKPPPPGASVQTHAFEFGIREAVERELGLRPPVERRQLIQRIAGIARAPIRRGSILDLRQRP